MNIRCIALVIAAALALSGCAQPEPDTVSPGTPAAPRTTALSGGLPDSSLVSQPLGRSLGLNLTACNGSESGVGVPSALVQAYLPDGLETTSDTTSNVQMDFYVCAKIGLEGVDSGPASFFMMQTPIQEPAGAPPGTHRAAMYVLEFRTDNAAVAAWASRGLLRGAPISVVNSFEAAPDPAWWAAVESTAEADGNAMYHVQALPNKPLYRTETLYRWYFDTDPMAFWEVRTVAMHSMGDGAGILEVSEDSTFAAITNGATRYHTLTAAENVEYQLITPGVDAE